MHHGGWPDIRRSWAEGMRDCMESRCAPTAYQWGSGIIYVSPSGIKRNGHKQIIYCMMHQPVFKMLWLVWHLNYSQIWWICVNLC